MMSLAPLAHDNATPKNCLIRVERWRRWLDRATRAAGEELDEDAAYLAFDAGTAPAQYVAGLPYRHE